MVLTILLFVIILGLLVFVHEFGHFASARRLGVGVEEFGFGFPPRLFGIRRGATIYSVNLIPFGGFVRLKGETGAPDGSSNGFVGRPAWKRLVILLSGVVMNFVLAALLFSLVFSVGIPAVLDGSSFPSGGRIASREVQVVGVVDQSPAAEAGFRAGDIIVSIDSATVSTIENVQSAVSQKGGGEVAVQLKRDDRIETLAVRPRPLEGSAEPRLGVSLAQTGLVTYPWYQALWLGPWYALRMLGLIFASVSQLIANLVVQGTVSGDVTGPIGIAVVTGQVADLGFSYVLQFTALLSLSLAAMNVLPIPALDGGRALFVLIEKLRRRPVSPRVEGLIHTVGFYLLLLLIMVISYRDFFRFRLNERLTDFFKQLGS